MSKYDGMTIEELFMDMSEGVPGTLIVLLELASDPSNLPDIVYCDSLGIRGSKFYKLFSDCCHQDIDMFRATVNMFRIGLFTDSEIDTNLGLVRSIPFIDDSISINGYNYKNLKGGLSKNWMIFNVENRLSFDSRIAEAIKHSSKREDYSI